MSTDTTQLKALRDALPIDTAPNTRAWVDRAIASLEAAEQPPAEQTQQPARTHCTCAFDDVPGEYPCAVHGEEPMIPLAQHEAIVAAVQGQVAEARRDGLREALELVERDAKRVGSTWYDCRQILTIAADGIRALAEKGGEVGK